MPTVTSDWSRFVDETDPEARYVVSESDIDRLGLRVAYEAFIAPAPEPEPPAAKEFSTPPNKAARRPSTK